MLLSISIKKVVVDEAEAKVFCDDLQKYLGDVKTFSISVVTFTEIVKATPMPIDVAKVEVSKVDA